MTAYFIKCRSVEGLEGISTHLYYWKDQAEQVISELNAKKDGYTYFLHQANI